MESYQNQLTEDLEGQVDYPLYPLKVFTQKNFKGMKTSPREPRDPRISTTGVKNMNKQEIVVVEVVKGRPFEILIDDTLKSLKRDSTFYSREASHLLTKPGLLALIKSFEPEDSIELLMILQFLIGYLWGAEKLSCGHDFESFTNLSL